MIEDFDLAQGLMVMGLAILVFLLLWLLLRFISSLKQYRQPDDDDYPGHVPPRPMPPPAPRPEQPWPRRRSGDGEDDQP